MWLRRDESAVGARSVLLIVAERDSRLADGFIFFGGGIDHRVDAWRRLRDRVAGVGRSIEDFGADYVALPHGGVGGLAA
jgi:hypothetical protein